MPVVDRVVGATATGAGRSVHSLAVIPRRSMRVRGVGAVAVALVSLGLLACSNGDGGRFGDEAFGTTPSTDDTASSAPASSEPAVSSSSTTSSTSSTSTTSSSTTTTTIDPASVAHHYPIDLSINSSFTPEAHASYRATDIFSSDGCGTPLLAPVTGTVDEVQQNTYDRATDDPAARGGNAVAILGDDGVRYYMAHFQAVEPNIVPGARVTAGDLLGQMGETGRAGACHVHFALSLPCPEHGDWWIRRGVIWPDRYLDSWKAGENLSPLPELQQWFAEYPDACRSVDDTPYPVG